MTHDPHLIEIIHAGAAEVAVGHRKARRLDDMRLDIQAGAQAQDGAGVLRNVGLEERNTHSESDFAIPGTPRGVSDMDDPDVGFFDAVMNAIWVSCDEPTP